MDEKETLAKDGMYVCSTCGRTFELKQENRYVTKSNNAMTLFTSFVTKKYDTFDCPHCGCQNIMEERLSEVVELNATEEDIVNGKNE